MKEKKNEKILNGLMNKPTKKHKNEWTIEYNTEKVSNLTFKVMWIVVWLVKIKCSIQCIVHMQYLPPHY